MFVFSSSYTCCTLKAGTSCYDGETAWTTHGGSKTQFLNRKIIACKANYMLSFFRMQSNDKNVSYMYRCCTVKESLI